MSGDPRFIRALIKFNNPCAVEPLIEALKHEDCLVREEVAKFLIRMGDPIAIEPLINLLNDNAYDIRLRVAKALVIFYSQNKLDDTIKKRILESKGTITQNHYDDRSCENQKLIHYDSGIGLDFPD